MSRRAEIFSVAVGFLLLGSLASYPLIFRLGTQLANGDPVLTAWTLAWDAERLGRGLQGIWDAPNFFPYRHTLLYSDHLLGIAIFTAPVQWLTSNPVLVYNLAFLASYAVSGVGMYVLVRSLTGRWDAAVVAAAIYVCQPFRVAHAAHLQWLITGWLPLSLWALHRYFSTTKLSLLIACAAFYLLQALTATYFLYFGLVPLVIVAVFEAWRNRAPVSRLVAHASAAGVLAAVVLLPVVRAYYDVRHEHGLRRSTNEIAIYSADVRDYWSAGPALRFWGNLGTGRGEHELFPGLLAIGLAILCVVAEPRARLTRVYALVAVGAFVLSLGPTPTFSGHPLGIAGPYRLLLAFVPGLDGIRAPARLAVVVGLALAVLGGAGSRWLIDRLPSRARALRLVLPAAIVSVVAVGAWPGRIRTPTFYAAGDPQTRDAYEYLKGLPAGAVMELPTSDERLDQEFVYQYLTLVHGHQVVNGHSGYVSPLLVWLSGAASPLREVERQQDVLRMLRGMAVRYIVVHRDQYSERSVLEALSKALEQSPDQVVSHRLFGETIVAVLSPLELATAEGRLASIGSTRIKAAATHSSDRVSLLLDGNRDSRWFSGAPQGGTERLDLEFEGTHDVAAVRIQLGERSLGDYPRDLAIEAIDVVGGTRTLYRGTVLPQLARGLIADGEYPVIDVVLPHNRTRRLRIAQLGRSRGFYWSIHELQIMERLP